MVQELFSRGEFVKTQLYSSKSNSTIEHTVTLKDNGSLVCTCRGFRTPNKCWHVKDFATKHGLNIAIGGELFGNSITGYGCKTTPKVEQLTIDLQDVARQEAVPVVGGFVKPMLASALPDGKSIADYPAATYVLEQKIDGHRHIVERTVDGKITAWSRAGNVRELAPHILEALEHVAPATYDGELYVPGGTSTDVTDDDNFHRTRLVLFDILRVGTYSAMPETGTERRKLLEVACSKLDSEAVHVIDQFDPSADMLEAIWAAGLEGIIIKRRAAIYQAGKRSHDWVKFKKLGAAEIIITGFIAGKLGPYSRIVGKDRHGIEVKVKTLNDQWRADFAKQAADWTGGPDGFKHPAIGRTLVISYQEKTRDGKYRHPMADHLLP